MSHQCRENRVLCETLFRQWREGDASRLSELFELLSEWVTCMVRKRGVQGVDLEENAQSVCIRVFSSANTFRPERGTFSAWIASVVRSTLCDWYRKQNRHPMAPLSEEPFGPHTTPESEAERAERIALVRRALAHLDAEQRAVLRMRYEEGLSYREIAEQLGGVPMTSMYRLVRNSEAAVRQWLPFMD